jgi:hypothetical protein
VKFTGPGAPLYPDTMTRIPPPRRSPPRNNRILSLLRKQLRRGPAAPATPNTILTEAGNQLQAENGHFLRTEQ